MSARQEKVRELLQKLGWRTDINDALREVEEWEAREANRIENFDAARRSAIANRDLRVAAEAERDRMATALRQIAVEADSNAVANFARAALAAAPAQEPDALAQALEAIKRDNYLLSRDDNWEALAVRHINIARAALAADEAKT